MALNTNYLSDQTTDFTSAVSVGSHLTCSTLSVLGTSHLVGAATLSGALNSASAISGGAITGTTITGTTIAASSYFSATTSSGGYLSEATTASATSATVADGEFAFQESTNTNVTLIYRSGNTTYHWVSSAGSVG